MYKRRDWLFTHGADGGGDETSSSEDGSSSGITQLQFDSFYHVSIRKTHFYALNPCQFLYR